MALDYDWVTTRLATGAALSSPLDAQQLADAGVTHIVDVTDAGADTPYFAALPGVQLLWNPTADDGQVKPPSWFQTSLAFAMPALAQPGNKVYAHCSAGVNRGPSTCYAIMLASGFTAADAEAEIRAARPIVNIAYKGDADVAVPQLGYS
jgi:protein-tyrosine phosphatase